MKKLLGLLGAVGLVASSSAGVVACEEPAAEDTKKPVELSTILKKTDAGVFEFNNYSDTSLPAAADILASLVKLNSGLVSTDLEVSVIARDAAVEGKVPATGSAVVKVKSDSKNYIYSADQTGIKVTFTTSKLLTDLSSIVTSELAALGNIDDNQSATILSKLIANVNTGDTAVDLTNKVEIKEGSITATSAILVLTDAGKVDYKLSEGSKGINLSFTATKQDLAVVIKTKALGEITSNENSALLVKINEINSLSGSNVLTSDDITITKEAIGPGQESARTTAKVSAVQGENSKYVGTDIVITYNFPDTNFTDVVIKGKDGNVISSDETEGYIIDGYSARDQFTISAKLNFYSEGDYVGIKTYSDEGLTSTSGVITGPTAGTVEPDNVNENIFTASLNASANGTVYLKLDYAKSETYLVIKFTVKNFIS